MLGFVHFCPFCGLSTNSVIFFSRLPTKFQIFQDYPYNYRFPITTREKISGFSGLPMKLQVFQDNLWNCWNRYSENSRFYMTTHQGFLTLTINFPGSPVLPMKFHFLQNYPLNSRFSRTRTNPVWPNKITIGIVNYNFLQNGLSKWS